MGVKLISWTQTSSEATQLKRNNLAKERTTQTPFKTREWDQGLTNVCIGWLYTCILICHDYNNKKTRLDGCINWWSVTKVYSILEGTQTLEVATIENKILLISKEQKQQFIIMYLSGLRSQIIWNGWVNISVPWLSFIVIVGFIWTMSSGKSCIIRYTINKYCLGIWLNI